MEAILKFNLDDKEDKKAHLRCIKSLDMAIAIFKIREYTFKSEKNVSSEFIFDVLKESNIDLEDLIDHFLINGVEPYVYLLYVLFSLIILSSNLYPAFDNSYLTIGDS
jgi:hypothetical protein